MTLRETQSLFCHTFCGFVVYAATMGYEFTFGEAYRTRKQAQRNAEAGTGIAESLHTERLAVDVNVFLKGRWLRGGATITLEEADAWERLGKLWEERHPLARWGGRFQNRDYNHFSFTYGGRA